MARFIKNKPYEGELGFGRNVTTNARIMAPDGTFKVIRESGTNWQNVYFHLMTMSWKRFFALFFLCFVLLNAFFALLYCALGTGQFNGTTGDTWLERFSAAFFFSSQTLTTVGYGHISPATLASSLLASFESFVGLLTFALISGLLYGRFSRPNAKVVFSETMVVAPYRDAQALMFRMGNTRRSELIEAEVQVIVTVNQLAADGAMERRYFTLSLEYGKISFFSMSWTVVHVLDEQSPLYGFSPEELIQNRAEFMVLLKAIEEANQQTVFTRHSYTADEIVWGAKFQPIMARNAEGIPVVKMQHIGDYTPVQK